MKTTDFKKLIKEAVREVFQEEMREILIEAVKSPKVPVGVPVGTGGYGTVTETQTISNNKSTLSEADKRNMFRNMIGDMARGVDTISMNTDNIPFRPSAANTAAEGSSLPPGELSMNQIMGLMSK
jgi:hypothetical protein